MGCGARICLVLARGSLNSVWMEFPWAFVGEGRTRAVTETLCRGQPWQLLLLCNAGTLFWLSICISWKKLQYFKLVKGTCDLCLVGLAEKNPWTSFFKFFIVFCLVSSANRTSYSCFKTFTAIAASCSRDICMREKMHPVDQLLWFCIKSRFVYFVCLGRKRSANSKFT